MERAPLRRAAVIKMMRVITPGGTIILSHYISNDRNPHTLAKRLIQADVSAQRTTIGCQKLQQTRFLKVRHNKMVAADRTSRPVRAQIN